MKLSEIQVKEIMARMETLIARKGMNKKDFYAASGISSSLYSQWNTGTVKPSLRLLAQAAETLGVEVDALINGKKEAPSEVGEREIGFDDFTFAMHNHSGVLTQKDKDILLSSAQQLADAHRKKGPSHRKI